MIEERVFKIAFERKWKILVRAKNSRRGELFWDEIMEKRQTRKRILESKRREKRGPVKENVLTTDRGNADWAEIRHRAAGTPFPVPTCGFEKKSTHRQRTQCRPRQRPMKYRRYVLSINAQHKYLATNKRLYPIVHYRVVSHFFSLYIFIGLMCGKIAKETRNFVALSQGNFASL